MRDASIVWRALTLGQFGECEWHIQRGLRDIGYGPHVLFENLALKMDFDSDGTQIRLGFAREDFRVAFKWAKSFALRLKESLKNHFVEEAVWKSLRELTTQAALWAGHEVPASSLKKIAETLNMDYCRLEDQWIEMRPTVVARIDEHFHCIEMTPSDFHSSVLLPALAKCNASFLRKLLVTAVITSSSTAQLEPDNKALRTLSGNSTNRLTPSTVGARVRLHLNFMQRCAENGGRHEDLVSSMVAGIKQVWDAENHCNSGRMARVSTTSDTESQRNLENQEFDKPFFCEADGTQLEDTVPKAAEAMFSNQAASSEAA